LLRKMLLNSGQPSDGCLQVFFRLDFGGKFLDGTMQPKARRLRLHVSGCH
jgi:hypothetical protein